MQITLLCICRCIDVSATLRASTTISNLTSPKYYSFYCRKMKSIKIITKVTTEVWWRIHAKQKMQTFTRFFFWFGEWIATHISSFFHLATTCELLWNWFQSFLAVWGHAPRLALFQRTPWRIPWTIWNANHVGITVHKWKKDRKWIVRPDELLVHTNEYSAAYQRIYARKKMPWKVIRMRNESKWLFSVSLAMDFSK